MSDREDISPEWIAERAVSMGLPLTPARIQQIAAVAAPVIRRVRTLQFEIDVNPISFEQLLESMSSHDRS